MDGYSEDCCFVCKDNRCRKAAVMLCNHDGCSKVYHPGCVGENNPKLISKKLWTCSNDYCYAFIKNKKLWTCSKHSCYVCRNSGSTTSAAVIFSCLCCPYALCDPCYTACTTITAAEFSQLRGKDKLGLCNDCLKVVRLAEANSEYGSDGEKLDFKNQDSFECRLKQYWEFIKKKEGLSSRLTI